MIFHSQATMLVYQRVFILCLVSWFLGLNQFAHGFASKHRTPPNIDGLAWFSIIVLAKFAILGGISPFPTNQKTIIGEMSNRIPLYSYIFLFLWDSYYIPVRLYSHCWFFPTCFVNIEWYRMVYNGTYHMPVDHSLPMHCLRHCCRSAMVCWSTCSWTSPKWQSLQW